MASPLAEANITAKLRLQQIIASVVATAWRGLPHYNREQVDEFLTAVLPITAAANQQAVSLTEAFLAQSLNRQPLGLNPSEIVAGIRNGTTPEQVYERSFVAVWSALKRGTPWEQAVKLGMDRATSAAATDVQLSFTHTLRAVGTLDDRIGSFERVPDAGACDFCRAAAQQRYHTGDLMPLHNHCGCGVEPISEPAGRAPTRFTGPGGVDVAVHDHGELGPVLTDANDHFTGQAAAAARANTNQGDQA